MIGLSVFYLEIFQEDWYYWRYCVVVIAIAADRSSPWNECSPGVSDFIAMMVPIEPLRAWMCPGSRAVVEYADDRYSHERVFLFPIDKHRWVVTTADDDTYEEDMRSYTRVRKMT